MNKQMWPRLGAVSGILFVVLLMGGESVPVGERAGSVAAMLGLIFFIPFLGYLFGVLRRAEAGEGWLSATAFGAGLVAFAMKFESGALMIASRGFGVRGLGDGTQTKDALIAINNASFMIGLALLGVMVAAASAVIIKTGVLPVWLGWAGILTGGALIINSTFLGADFGPAFLLFLLWTVLTSALLTRRAGAARDEGIASPESVGAEPVR